MSVLVYKRNWDTGQYRLIHEFGPEARGAEQVAGDLHVLSATGERPLLVISSGLWDTCLVDVGRGATRFEAQPPAATEADDGADGLASAI